MAALSILPKRPLCFSCLRGIFREELSLYPAHTQLRGKKKSAVKAGTINVKLLVDIKGFGKKGAITPVAPGRMRNSWYPRQQAEYLSTIEGLNPREVVAMRDFEFGMEAEEVVQEVETVVETVKLLPHQRATQILAATIPAEMIFYRLPITDPESETSVEETLPQQRRATSEAAAALAAASSSSASSPKKQLPHLINIFGSVTTADMAEALKAVLAEVEDGGRIMIGAEDIAILGGGPETGIEGDRLKALGEFPIEIRVRGGEAVTRRVCVRALG